ncbi:MAG TPA: MerR family transcriptional regulator [bacterium]|nr:MerR family transcriptional regulator [bacterium]
MQDLESRVLQAPVVAGLTGLSRRTLARWEALGIPPGRRSGAAYSWADVDALQRAAHLVRTRRLPLAEVKRFLSRDRAGAEVHAKRIVERPKPLPRYRRVVAVSLPRSAKRKGRV